MLLFQKGCISENLDLSQHPKKFTFYITNEQFGVGHRIWIRDSDNIWTETYQDERTERFKIDGYHQCTDGTKGIIVRRIQGGSDRKIVFIPNKDQEKDKQYLRINTNNDVERLDTHKGEHIDILSNIEPDNRNSLFANPSYF